MTGCSEGQRQPGSTRQYFTGGSSPAAEELDEYVAQFRSRPMDASPYMFVAANALVVNIREDGRVVNVHALVATGMNADGRREIRGLQVASAEDGAGWLSFFRDLTARGLNGVALVTSDAHLPPRWGAIMAKVARGNIALQLVTQNWDSPPVPVPQSNRYRRFLA